MNTNTDPVRALDYTPGRLDETAPERIWLQIDTAGNNADRDLPFPDADGVTWEQGSVGGLEIQYVRADLTSAPPSAPDDVNRLVRELDVALNGPDGAAAQASLCDLVSQVQRIVRERGAPPLAPSAPAGVDFAAVASILRHALRDGVHAGYGRNFILQQASALEAIAQQPAAPVLAKHQPCGCVICTCEDEQQCQGCGAKHCGNRADHPPYVVQQPAAPSGEAVATVIGYDPWSRVAVDWHRNDLPPGTKLYAAPQQPAGVGDLWACGFCRATYRLDALCCDAQREFRAALAAQQQEPTT